jgi:soluble lytic murein transglycosylase-like protein
MTKSIVLAAVCWLVWALLSLPAAAEILVVQDKEGKITITNENAGSMKKRYKGYKVTSDSVTYIGSAASSKVPSKYRAKIKKLAQKYGLEESLITAVIRAESGFNPFAVSKKGAVGIMQLMPDTARKYSVMNRYNEDQNMDAGVRHLKYLYKKYNGNLPLTLAAYNAGEEAVKKHGGIPPYKETRVYIKIVMAYMGMSDAGLFARTSTKIYQYRTPDGKLTITDTYPANAAGEVTVFE